MTRDDKLALVSRVLLVVTPPSVWDLKNHALDAWHEGHTYVAAFAAVCSLTLLGVVIRLVWRGRP
ncbi:MAG TPA: hypothetical protein VKA21_01625 [Candidatus Binatia bacterium]|nr:hypothetical protein [Candidatus Binatia bacterium]